MKLSYNLCSALAVLAAAAGVTCAVLASAAAVDSAAAAVGRKGLMPPDPSKHLLSKIYTTVKTMLELLAGAAGAPTQVPRGGEHF